jgi:hypothetical protein
MKKRFAAPVLKEEATLGRLTLFTAVSGSTPFPG